MHQKIPEQTATFSPKNLLNHFLKVKTSYS
jgi:hypothetical protein